MNSETKNENGRHALECLREADEAVLELRTAFARVGIALPSLRLDPISYAREAPCPLVELGRCSVETALRIAAALPKPGERA
ncbi:hypothetical protein QIS99_20965 [Streptomyces sp. B-S-A8]|uniref:Uncharacterized protein n=1 Tax=Streptomyces solicavernae TaxID=3043614 RepID=A0ABT6RW92_9ACTN|nr:hypothetical protein [Streptomyces sp. B-S-A8]MDI3388657.1 hypothetical protein [Streptomyces sp. B-S-A8]